MSQDARMRLVLARLELVSCAPTSSMASDFHKGAFGSRPATTGDANPPHEVYAVEYARQWTFDGCERVIRAAHGEWVQLTGNDGKPPQPRDGGESLDDLMARIAVDGSGWSVKDCEVHFRTTERIVCKARLRHGRDPDTGERVAGTESPLDRKRRARELKGRGMSTRQIGMLLGCGQATVVRDLAA